MSAERISTFWAKSQQRVIELKAPLDAEGLGPSTVEWYITYNWTLLNSLMDSGVELIFIHNIIAL